MMSNSSVHNTGLLTQESDVHCTMKDCSSLTSNVQNKRINPDSVSNDGKSENDPITLGNKRFKSKQGSDSLENSWCSVDSYNNKGETTPLCERNIKTKHKDSQDNQMDNIPLKSINVTNVPVDMLELNSSSSSRLEQPNLDNLYNSAYDSENNTMNPISNSVSGNVDLISNNPGGLSPHCAATLEYVTRLPEGCSNSQVCTELPCYNVTRESDEDIEDDDNYLDSSEPEENEIDTCPLNEDDEGCCEDDESIISSVTVGSTSSLRSIASETMNSVCMNENGMAANEDGSLLYGSSPSLSPGPAMIPSLFLHVPPVIHFCQYNETNLKLPLQISKLLKWRFTTITPLIVKKSISNSGFKITKKTVLWCGTWGKHMKSAMFKSIKDFQKINHFPGTFQIGRKDKLWKNFSRLQTKFGKEEFGFLPKTFVLPGEVSALKAAFDKEGVKKKWIVKPPASARGTGIQVVNKWSQMPVTSSVVVQRYISRPYLINNTKFDMRIYVLVTSFNPLIIYLYQDGLVRFASVEYQKNSKTLSDRYMHLTNYSVNKSSSSYTHNEDAGQCQGHKWTLKTLWAYLKAREVDTSSLWSRIADLVIKSIISGEHDIVVRTKKNTKSRYCCYELFGFDVILDERLRPWLLEVNISPSLHSASPLDHSVKGPLISHLLTLVGFHIPDKLTYQHQVELLSELQLGENVSSLCLDRRLYTKLLTPEDQAKHLRINAMHRSQYLASVLEILQPDDLRHLVLWHDQLNRAGKFSCIFPTCDTFQYFGFMEKPKYYNLLFDAWENMYAANREEGIERLKQLCAEQIHLKVPAKFKLPKVQDTQGGKSPQSMNNLSKGSEESTPTKGGEWIVTPNVPSPSTSKPHRNPSKKAVPRGIKVKALKPAIVHNALQLQTLISGRKAEIVYEGEWQEEREEEENKKENQEGEGREELEECKKMYAKEKNIENRGNKSEITELNKNGEENESNANGMRKEADIKANMNGVDKMEIENNTNENVNMNETDKKVNRSKSEYGTNPINEKDDQKEKNICATK